MSENETLLKVTSTLKRVHVSAAEMYSFSRGESSLIEQSIIRRHFQDCAICNAAYEAFILPSMTDEAIPLDKELFSKIKTAVTPHLAKLRAEHRAAEPVSEKNWLNVFRTGLAKLNQGIAEARGSLTEAPLLSFSSSSAAPAPHKHVIEPRCRIDEAGFSMESEVYLDNDFDKVAISLVIDPGSTPLTAGQVVAVTLGEIKEGPRKLELNDENKLEAIWFLTKEEWEKGRKVHPASFSA